MQKKPKKQKAARKIFEEQLNYNLLNESPEMDINEEEMMQSNMAPQQQQLSTPKKIIKAESRSKPVAQNIIEQVTSEELQQEKGELEVRETGWLWKTVVIPPNSYVVHTRRGYKKPLTLGLGTSFRYNPLVDSYLVVPAAMQTIGIVVQGISREKQGISILAYVQWLINDFAIAYQRLDFSDKKNPMGIVNAQLREQAEAAIKDKIATMSVEEILTDKAPIIKELTERLKAVTEGNVTGEDGGLGIKIVTVQIKEAFVSSQQLWEHLQAPFRNEREREARLSRLRVEEEVRQQELTNRRKIENSEAETQSEIEKFKAQKQSESSAIVIQERIAEKQLQSQEQEQKIQIEEKIELTQRDSQKKLTQEQEKSQQEFALVAAQNEQQLMLERKKLELNRLQEEKNAQIETKIKQLEQEEKLREYEKQLQLKKLKDQEELEQKQHHLKELQLKQDMEIKDLEEDKKLQIEEKKFRFAMLKEEEKNRLVQARKEKELLLAQKQQEICNSIHPNDIHRRLVEIMPELASSMPDIQELKTLQINDSGGNSSAEAFVSFFTKLLAIGKNMEVLATEKKPDVPKENEDQTR